MNYVQHGRLHADEVYQCTVSKIARQSALCHSLALSRDNFASVKMYPSGYFNYRKIW